jgi:hypothetical protein
LIVYGTPFATGVNEGARKRDTLTSQTGGPMKSILDPSFRYTKSVETDLRKTFARVRRELRKQQQEQSVVRAEAVRKVVPFNARKAAS